MAPFRPDVTIHRRRAGFGPHQREQFLRSVEGLLVSVRDAPHHAVPRLVRSLRRGNSNDERLHTVTIAPGLQVGLGWVSGPAASDGREAARLEVEFAHPVGIVLVAPAGVAVAADRRQRAYEFGVGGLVVRFAFE